jgi:hypothetical protein
VLGQLVEPIVLVFLTGPILKCIQNSPLPIEIVLNVLDVDVPPLVQRLVEGQRRP